MKRLPLGVQTFSDFIEKDYLYVDKTREIFQFFDGDGKYFFMSRPRRFGKSLLVSTLKDIFSGNKDLFKGLWIYDKIDWDVYPVIHIDFTKISYKNREVLEDSLRTTIGNIAERNHISLADHGDYKIAFAQLIEKLATQNKNRVVILIDEYDKPIIDHIEHKEIATENRDVLREFYAVIKGADEFNHFAFITGVSKFSKVSVFSGLNNLVDITVDAQFSTLLGYTHEELTHYFNDRLEQLSGGDNAQQEGWLEDIKAWYNGYSWDGTHFVYNPFSVLNFFRKKKFGNYWFESGSPTWLIKLIHRYKIDVASLEGYKTGEFLFGAFDIDRIHVVSLLFQTGYLTIKKVLSSPKKRDFFILDYPNIEVKEAFMEFLLADVSTQFADTIAVQVEQLRDALNLGDEAAFFEVVRSIFAGIPYDIFVGNREGYYQTVIYLILKLIGVTINVEVETNQGRIDAVLETDDVIYVMEFKLGTPEEALAQIKEKKYYERFTASKKTVKLAGIGFDVDQKNIKGYKVEDTPKS